MSFEFQDVLVPYRKNGVYFEYPDIWELTEQVVDNDTVISVSASETCFWLLRIVSDCSPPPQVVEACMSAFREEYDDLEEDTPDTSLAEMPAAAADATFFCMDMMNSIGLRSVRTMDFTLLLWWQSTHLELEENQDALQHMSQSVRLESMLD